MPRSTVGTMFYYKEPSTGVAQVETATAAGTVTTAGNATVILTAAGFPGSPKTFSVPVALNDTAATVAGKIRDALNADLDVIAMFVVGGSTTAIVLTKKIVGADDATLNLSIANGTCVGLTAAPTSANTTTGVAQTSKQIYGMITKPAMPGLPSRVEATSQEDTYQKTTAGYRQMPDANFQFKYHAYDSSTSNYEKFLELEEASANVVFGIKYPDDMAIEFSAKPYVQRDGTGVNALDTFTVSMFDITNIQPNVEAPANITLVTEE